jgi:hypothetical protein
LDRSVESAAPDAFSSTRRGEIASVSRELQRELARLEQMPWPSGRVLVTSRDGRPLERRLVPLLRELRDQPATGDEPRRSPAPRTIPHVPHPAGPSRSREISSCS